MLQKLFFLFLLLCLQNFLILMFFMFRIVFGRTCYGTTVYVLLTVIYILSTSWILKFISSTISFQEWNLGKFIVYYEEVNIYIYLFIYFCGAAMGCQIVGPDLDTPSPHDGVMARLLDAHPNGMTSNYVLYF